VEKCLTAAGCIVSKVSDGDKAVSRVRREMFDTAVLVSTGKEMDLAETVFTLKDVRSSMGIVIVADRADTNGNVIATIASTVPNITVLSLHTLKAMLEAFRGKPAREA
jgi:DNA-binding response OmpR family regulator